jgi:hypothetical protein
LLIFPVVAREPTRRQWRRRVEKTRRTVPADLELFLCNS